MSEPTILDEIVQARLQQLESQISSMPESSMVQQLKPSDRDFSGMLTARKPAFILECKKASPSKGLIRPDFDLVTIAKTYGGFASAISVLTESEYFQGALANLGIVRFNSEQPLLAKDFFVNRYQVYQARHFGADAILLILAILTDDQWRELNSLAVSLDMDVLTEVSNEEEQQRAISLGATIVGINNRNLRDMSVDLETTIRLAKGLPESTLVVSESGYSTHRQVRQMSQYADGFLVGSALMQHRRLPPEVRRLIFGECKVCGLTRNEDARVVDRAGAVYGGVIFADSSPRKVEFRHVEQIFEGTELVRVGVFQDHTIDQVVNTTSQCRLDVLQFHGDEDGHYISNVANELGDRFQYWKAISIDQLQDLDFDNEFPGVDRFVVDNHFAGMRGGTGEMFDWELLPDTQRDKLIIAGGIGKENVLAAVKLGCAGIDLNSKLEIEPGVKDSEEVEETFALIRDYSQAHG